MQQDAQSVTLLRNAPAASVPGAPTEAIQKLVAVQDRDGKKAVRMYIAFSPSSEVRELMLFQSDLSAGQKYTAVLTPFIRSLHFSDPIAPEGSGGCSQPQPAASKLPEGVGGGGLNGWYARSTSRFVAGVNFTGIMKVVWQFYRFFPDGWIYTSMPPQGDINTLKCPQAGVGQGRCERYQLSARSITIGQSKPESFEFVPGPDHEIRLGGQGTWPITPLRRAPLDDMKLSVGAA